MGVSKVDFFGRTLIDLTADTVDAHSLRAGRTAHGADGELVEGLLGKEASFAPGTTLAVNVSLRDGAGGRYALADGEVLRFRLWHGTSALDAESTTEALSVDVPADADMAVWHYWLRLERGGKMYLAACGDAKCAAGGDAALGVEGVVDAAREWLTSGCAWDTCAFSDERESVGDSAFRAFAGVELFCFPSATSLGQYAFFNCASLTAVDLPSATSIDTSAINKCSSLTAVDLPSATSIGGNAFYGCSSLAAVDLPSATSIGASAFYGCSSLAAVDLPSATSIGASAFFECTGVKSASLPSATSIGSNAFYRCFSLKTFTLGGDKVCALVNATVFYLAPLEAVYVPDALVDDYKAATNWATYASVIKPLSEKGA